MSKSKNKGRVKVKKLRLFLVVLLTAGFIVAGAIGAYLLNIIVTSPDISLITVSPRGFTTVLYDKDGSEYDKLHGEKNRIYVTLDKIPQVLQDAFVAVEDKRFFKHNGIDFRGILRSIYVNIKTFSFSQGASTITQQLIRNNLLTFDKELDRKIREQFMAYSLEAKLRKEMGKEKAKLEILELYLNTISLGSGTNGVQAATNRYFGKDVSELNLSEAAVIAAITQNPSRYDPVRFPENNKKRRGIILKALLDQKYITKEEYDKASSDDPYVNISNYNEYFIENNKANSYFTDQIIEELKRDLMKQKGLTDIQAVNLIYSGGLKIYTTIDPVVQNAIDKVFSNQASSFAKNGVKYTLVYNLDVKKANDESKYYQKTATVTKLEDVDAQIQKIKGELMEEGDTVSRESHFTTMQPQAAMIIIDYTNGYVRGLAGGRGSKVLDRDLNRATQSVRQTGSTFKPLSSFIPAIDMGVMTAGSVLDDTPIVVNGKFINNWWGNSYTGLANLRKATERSMNIIAVKNLLKITPEKGYDYLIKFGFTTLVSSRREGNQVFTDKTASLALGGLTDGVSLIELTSAYGAVANGGVLVKPTFYTKVLDNNGREILTHFSEKTQVIKEETAYIATTMLRDVITGSQGTGGSAGLSNVPVAGKTGTTSDNKDLLFVGYTPYNYVGGLWFGYDKPETIKGDQSIHTKAWKAVMAEIHAGLKWKDFPRPTNVTTAIICRDSGLLPTDLCELDPRGNRCYSEYFAKGTVPSASCNVHVLANVTTVDGVNYLVNPALGEFFPIEEKVLIKRPEGFTYDPKYKGLIADTIYEVPAEYYDPFGISPTEPDSSDPDDILPGIPIIPDDPNDPVDESGDFEIIFDET